jgi:hypothetical protein
LILTQARQAGRSKKKTQSMNLFYAEEEIFDVISVIRGEREIRRENFQSIKSEKMTSVYPQSGSSMMSYSHTSSNFQAISHYGLSYYDSSISDYSDGYQSSVSPDLHFSHHSTTTFKHQHIHQQHQHHHHQQQQQQNCYQNDHDRVYASKEFGFYQPQPSLKSSSITCKDDLSTKRNLKIITNCTKESSIDLEQRINDHDDQKSPLAIAPEIMKRRRTAANARERRRMNNLNYAFDK